MKITECYGSGFVADVVNVVDGFCDILCRRRRDGFVGHVWVDQIRKFLQFLHILHRNFVQFGTL